ncbi:MAG: prepilin-type N-terminal cleavage/methylation domain-containing protein [Polyangiaceae bacterium]|nr:prepilin-type N-terminal cleavage/methylation domain-containing protein [Polyangiaceae bacterium]
MERSNQIENRARAARDRGRARDRGVTLIEVMIVVTILAMVAGGVAVFALPQLKKAQIKTATDGCRTIRQAVNTWQMDPENSSCPSVSQLIEERILDKGTNTSDPWNQPFTIQCTDNDVIVTSAGPDKKKGTADDISVPKGAGAGE